MADNDAAEFFPTTVGKDFLDLFAGKRLGSGIARIVYEHNLDPTLVIKIEMRSKDFQNVMEWENWRSWREAKDIAPWLAPCIDISPCGTVLLQKRTKPVDQSDLPARLPAFLTDTKVGNFGKFDGRIVCHDYAKIITSASMRFKKAHWWS